MEREAERCTVDFSFVHQHGNDVTELIDASAGSSVLDLLRQRCFDDQAVRERISVCRAASPCRINVSAACVRAGGCVSSAWICI